MVRPVAASWSGSLFLAALATQADEGWLRWALDYCGDVLILMAALATMVLTGWNVLHPDREKPEPREAAAPGRLRYLGPPAAYTPAQGMTLPAFRDGCACCGSDAQSIQLGNLDFYVCGSCL